MYIEFAKKWCFLTSLSLHWKEYTTKKLAVDHV